MAPVSKIVYSEGVLTPSSSPENHHSEGKSSFNERCLSKKKSPTTKTTSTQINQDLIKNYQLISK